MEGTGRQLRFPVGSVIERELSEIGDSIIKERRIKTIKRIHLKKKKKKVRLNGELWKKGCDEVTREEKNQC